jgi:aspartate 1-decarboxylase
MWVETLKSKIHKATVTDANLNYEGSITIDEELIDAANMFVHEKVAVVNNNNGERFETYIIRGERGSGIICLNGAAARKVQKGDVIIIMSYAMLPLEEAKLLEPAVVHLEPGTNTIKR